MKSEKEAKPEPSIYSTTEALRFCKVRKGTKKPFEKDWTNKPYTWEEIQEHISNELNFGVLCGYGGLIVIDCDTKELAEAVNKNLPETFRIKTGSGGTHNYYFCKEAKKKIVLQNGKNHYGEVQSTGSQVVGAESIHPNGNKYEILINKPIAEISYNQLILAVKPFMQEVLEAEKRVLKEIKSYGSSDINSISITQVMDISGFKKASNGELYGGNKWHGSSTGTNTWINESKNIAHCFRCNYGINVARAIALNENIISNCSDNLSKQDFIKVLKIANEKYGLKKPELKKISDEQIKGNLNFIKDIYYDAHGLFWIWSTLENKWEMVDETDILNLFEKNGWETKAPKYKAYILNLSKQEGRKNKPLEPPKFAICFKNCLYNIINKQQIPISSKYFITNPIPYNLTDKRNTPTIDKLMREWVIGSGQDESYVITLKEIIAYSCIREQFLQTIIFLTGSGSNGKGVYQTLVTKFLGKDNVCSSSLKALVNRNFETSALYKKLLCIMGEADTFDLSNSNIIKQLTGEDLIRFEFKGKTPFSDYSPTTIMVSTNSLPRTPDKSNGFYRRVFVIDFPNQFSITRDLLSQIPEEEYEALCRQVVEILEKLNQQNNFTNGGDIQERRLRYEERSSPLMQFITENYQEDGTDFIKLREFYNKYNASLINKRLRPTTIFKMSRELREEGFDISTRKVFDTDGEVISSDKSIIGLKSRDNAQGVMKSGGLGGSELTKPPEPPQSDIWHDNQEPLNIEVIKIGKVKP